MFDFANDDYVTVVLPKNLYGGMHSLPAWFLKVINEIVSYYSLPIPFEKVIRDRCLLEAYLTKCGFEFEYFDFDNITHTDYNTGATEKLYHTGYVFKSTPELSAYILKVKEPYE